jgi:hypothetical protein
MKDIQIADMKDYHKTFVGLLKVYKVDNARQVFKVKNDYMGRTFIAMLRKALNNSKYTIRVRGSQSDRKKYREQGIHLSDQSVPLKYADTLRVYIEGVVDYQAVRNSVNADADYFKGLYVSAMDAVSKSNNDRNRLMEENNKLQDEIEERIQSMNFWRDAAQKSDDTIIELQSKLKYAKFKARVNSSEKSRILDNARKIIEILGE